MAARSEHHSLSVGHALELLAKQTKNLHKTIDAFVGQVINIGKAWLEQKEGNTVSAEEMSLLIEKTAQFVTGRGTDFKVEPDFVRNILAQIRVPENADSVPETTCDSNSDNPPVTENKSEISTTCVEIENADSQVTENLTESQPTEHLDAETDQRDTSNREDNGEQGAANTEDRDSSLCRLPVAEESESINVGTGKTYEPASQVAHLSKKLRFVTDKYCQLEKQIEWLTAKQTFTEKHMENSSGRQFAFEKKIIDEATKLAKQGDELSSRLTVCDTDIRQISAANLDIGNCLETVTTQLNDIRKVTPVPADMFVSMKVNNEKLTEHASLLWKITSQQSVLEKQIEGVSSMQHKMEDNQGRRMSSFHCQVQKMSRQQADIDNRCEGISMKLSDVKKQIEECSTKQANFVKYQNQKVGENEAALKRLVAKQSAVEKNMDTFSAKQTELGEKPGKRLSALEKQLTETSEKQALSTSSFENVEKRLSFLEKQLKLVSERKTAPEGFSESPSSWTKKLEDLKACQSTVDRQLKDTMVKVKSLETQNTFMQDCQLDTAKQLTKISSRQFELEKDVENSTLKQAQLEKHVSETQNGTATKQSELNKKIEKISTKQINSTEQHSKKLNEAEKQINKLKSEVGKQQEKRTHNMEKEIANIYTTVGKFNDNLVRLTEEVTGHSGVLKEYQLCLNSVFSKVEDVEKCFHALKEEVDETQKYAKSQHNTLLVLQKLSEDQNRKVEDMYLLHDELVTLVNSTCPSVPDLAKKIVSTDMLLQDISGRVHALFTVCQEMSTDLETLMKSHVAVRPTESENQTTPSEQENGDLEAAVKEGEGVPEEADAEGTQSVDMINTEERQETPGSDVVSMADVSTAVDKVVKRTQTVEMQVCEERLGSLWFNSVSTNVDSSLTLKERLEAMENLFNNVKYIENLACTLKENGIHGFNSYIKNLKGFDQFLKFAEKLDKANSGNILYRLWKLESRQENVEDIMRRVNILESKTVVLEKRNVRFENVAERLKLVEDDVHSLEDKVKIAEGDKTLLPKVDFMNDFHERLQAVKGKQKEPKVAAIVKEVQQLVKALLNYIECSCLDAVKVLSGRVKLMEEKMIHVVNLKDLLKIAERLDLVESMKKNQQPQGANVESRKGQEDQAEGKNAVKKEACEKILKQPKDSHMAETVVDCGTKNVKARVDPGEKRKKVKSKQENLKTVECKNGEESSKACADHKEKSSQVLADHKENLRPVDFKNDQESSKVISDQEESLGPVDCKKDEESSIILAEHNYNLKSLDCKNDEESSQVIIDHEESGRPVDCKNDQETSKVLTEHGDNLKAQDCKNIEDCKKDEESSRALGDHEDNLKPLDGKNDEKSCKTVADHGRTELKLEDRQVRGSKDVVPSSIKNTQGTLEYCTVSETDVSVPECSSDVQEIGEEKKAVQAITDTLKDVRGRLHCVENARLQQTSSNGLRDVENRVRVMEERWVIGVRKEEGSKSLGYAFKRQETGFGTVKKVEEKLRAVQVRGIQNHVKVARNLTEVESKLDDILKLVEALSTRLVKLETSLQDST